MAESFAGVDIAGVEKDGVFISNTAYYVLS